MLKYIILLSLSVTFISFSQINQVRIDSLKASITNVASDADKSEVFTELVKEYFDFNQDSAEVYIKKTIKLTEGKSPLKKARIISFLNYAQISIIRGNYKLSKDYYDKSWDILKDNYYYDLYIKYYGDKGVLNFYEGDFRSALNSFNDALLIAEKEKNQEDILRYLNNKALAMSYLGEAEASLEVHEKAISMAETLNDSTALGKSFNNIGLIYEDMKAYNKALTYYLKALEIKKNGNSEIDVANSLFNVAGMYKEIGEQNSDTLLYSKAESYYDLAINKSKENNYGKVLLFSKTGLAQLATARGNPLKAIAIYNEVVKEAIKSNDAQTLRVTYLNLGVNHLKLNNSKTAEHFLLKSKPLIEKAENPSDLSSLYKNLSALYESLKMYDKAYDNFKKFHKISTNLSKNSLKDKISEFEVKYETEKKEKEILVQRAELAENKLDLNRKNTQLIGLALVAVLLSLLGYLLYKQQKLKNLQLQKEAALKTALVRIETQNKLQDQRLRISRDLHDNIGAQLTFVISSIENLQYGFNIKNEQLQEKLTGISSFTRDTIDELRDTIWAMNKSKISLEDLQTRISNFVEKANKYTDGVKFNFSISDAVSKDISFTSVEGMNIYRIVQEAINNAIKYAEAKQISVNISNGNNNLHIEIIDDGKGFDVNSISEGNGLYNMRKRANDINASLNIKSKTNNSTIVTLNVSL